MEATGRWQIDRQTLSNTQSLLCTSHPRRCLPLDSPAAVRCVAPSPLHTHRTHSDTHTHTMSPAYRRWKVWGGVGRILYVSTTSTHPYVNVSALYLQKRKDGKDIWASSGACIMHMARLCVFNAIGIYPHTQIGSPPKNVPIWFQLTICGTRLSFICIFFSFF